MNYTIIAALLLFLVSSCKDEKKERALEERISTLEKQLDDCQNGEDKLMGLIRNSFDSKNYKLASKTYTELSNKFPSSTYLSEARDIFTKSNEEIANEQKAAADKKAKEEADKKASLTKLKKDYDDVSGVTWYDQKYFTHYTNSNKTSIQIGHRKGSVPWLILFMSYTGDDWIFFKDAYLSFEGNTKEISFNDYQDKKTDNGSGGVWEWIKVSIDDSEIDWYKKFASSTDAKMRLSGKYQNTRNLTSQERQGILDIIAGYEYLKENP